MGFTIMHRGDGAVRGRCLMAFSPSTYEINRDTVSRECAHLQAQQVRKGDDQIRTGVPAHRADCLRINRDALESNAHPQEALLENTFDAKPHSHWPVLQRPTSATGKAA